jgi:hypothetical protein
MAEMRPRGKTSLRSIFGILELASGNWGTAIGGRAAPIHDPVDWSGRDEIARQESEREGDFQT